MVDERLEEWIIKEGCRPMLWDVRDVREGAIRAALEGNLCRVGRGRVDRKGALGEGILEMVPGERVARSPQVAGCGGWREQSGDCGGPVQAANT